MRQSSDLPAGAWQRLEQRQMRLTTARRMVLEAIQLAAGPQSAAELAERVGKSVPMSSLYRTLNVLDEAGVIERYHDHAGVARYELAEWLTGHHHHLTCVVCGWTGDVAVPDDLETAIGQIATAIGERFDFSVDGHRLDLQGVCAKCQ